MHKDKDDLELANAELISHLAEYGIQFCIDHEDFCKPCREIKRLYMLWIAHENTS